jgi:hypothetical protein
LEIDLLQLTLGIQHVVEEGLESLSELFPEMAQNFSVPGIILGVNFVEDKPIVDDEGTKRLFSLAVVKGASVFTNLVEQCLPLIDVITQSFVDFLGVDDPKGLVVEPNLEIIFRRFKNTENLAISVLQHFGSHFEQHIFVVLLSLLFFHKRALILVAFQSGKRADKANDSVELLRPHKFGML